MSVSIYGKETPATKEDLAKAVMNLKYGLPDLATDPVCFEIVRLAQGMCLSKAQIEASVDNCLRTHKYNDLKPSDILEYDNRVKFYNGEHVRKVCGSYGEEEDRRRFPRVGQLNPNDPTIYSVCAEEIANLPICWQEKIWGWVKKYEAFVKEQEEKRNERIREAEKKKREANRME